MRRILSMIWQKLVKEIMDVAIILKTYAMRLYSSLSIDNLDLNRLSMRNF